jgi:protein required for attachment to host cells
MIGMESMTYAALATGTHILVGDGKRALILVNEGTAYAPSLAVETVLEQDDPINSALGSDRPGRVFASIGPRSGSAEPVDWHQLAEDRFAHEMVKGLVELAKRERLKRLVLVAPPRTLAELRRAMPDEFARLIVAEFRKDLTKHPVKDILHHLLVEMAA